MRILHLSSEQTWRGGEQQIAYLIEELRLQNIESTVVLRAGSAFEEHCRKFGIDFVTASFRNEFDLKTAFIIKKTAQQKSIDVVHIHTGKSHGLAVLAAKLGMETPLVLSKRTDHPIKPNWFSRYKFNFAQIQKILCVSKKIKQIIDPDLRESSRSMTIYSGIDLTKFKFETKNYFHDFFKLERNIRFVGNTAAISDHKDYFTFVNTAEKVCERDSLVRFLIIGGGPMEAEIRDYVRSKNLADKVLFTGFLNNLNEVLFNLDVFLITSKEEGLGTSILDAHACGVPVVATRAGGIPEIVIDGKTGALCEIGDAANLARAVQARLEDRETFQAKEFVKGFSKQATATNTLAVYRDILKANSSSRTDSA